MDSMTIFGNLESFGEVVHNVFQDVFPYCFNLFHDFVFLDRLGFVPYPYRPYPSDIPTERKSGGLRSGECSFRFDNLQ